MKALLPFALFTGFTCFAVAGQEMPIDDGMGPGDQNVAGDRATLPPRSPLVSPAWHGLWEGAIGELPVRLCLVQDEHWSFGAYYDLRSRRAIHLEQPAGQSGVWVEEDNRDPDRPRWTLASVGVSQLTGQWRQGVTTRPVRLRRVAGLETGEGPCGSLHFNRPRFFPTRIISRSDAQGGARYTRLAMEPFPAFPGVTIHTFVLDGRTAAVRRINSLLRRVLPGEPMASEWFRCVSANLNSVGNDGEFLHTIEPSMISGRWLAATERWEGWSCGGLSPSQDIIERTFDIERGLEVNLHDWLNARAARRRRHPGAEQDSRTLTLGFRRWLVANRLGGEDDNRAECRAVVLDAEYWDIRLTHDGLAFTPDLSRVVMACGEEFHVPFRRLAPFLSPRGLAGAASLRGAARSAENAESATR